MGFTFRRELGPGLGTVDFEHVDGCICPDCSEARSVNAVLGDRVSPATLFDLRDFEVAKSELDADRASLGVDINGEPPVTYHSAVPMDDGNPRDADKIVPGFYRHYDAVCGVGACDRGDMPLIACEIDRQQIAYDIARECPVTAQVVFRLVDGQVVAHLVSYVAFA